jgi:hypothetical protein
VIVERRQAMADALGTVAELAGNVHPYKPDALAPPVGYVDHVQVTRNGPTLRTLSLTAEIVFVADGLTMAARQLLDGAAAHAWTALIRAGCTPQSTVDGTLSDLPSGPDYAAVRMTVTTPTDCSS